MTVDEWTKLKNRDFSEYKRKFNEFLYDRTNAFKCYKCPENEQIKDCNKYPCGQYNCWVMCANRIGIE